MNEDRLDIDVSSVAAAIGLPARARMLGCLLDGRARSSTELAVVGEVTPPTASVHLKRLLDQQLVTVARQGRHRTYSLAGPEVAAALEALHALADSPRQSFESRAPNRLRAARTCYDHLAGRLGVVLLDRFLDQGWLLSLSGGFELAEAGTEAFVRLGIDVDATRALRRRFAYPCLDWSERRPHLGGALAAALLTQMLARGWAQRDLDSRALSVTREGRRQLLAHFGATIED